ncbi:MAG: sodium:proton antiporter [Acidobacteria bacterium]|nr:sodium:proton antiporter [Acidobacteriota bacterium]MCB9398659.1 sodium:proton antiporter [Acidobacteriota bacterium]
MNSWLSVLPPILAIAIALWRKEVVIALVVGIFSAEFLLADFNLIQGFIGTLERCVAVFSDADNTRVLVFGLLVGAVLELMRISGGVSAFVQKLAHSGLTQTKRQVSWLASLIGLGIFVETSMSCLTAGVVSQSLFDKFKMSRARLAFIVDSTCAPVSVLVLLNGWGAYILRLLEGQSHADPLGVMIGGIAYNFYPILVLLMVFFTATTGKVFGPMKESEEKLAHGEGQREEVPPSKARFMVVPLFFLVFGMIGFMFMTGWARLTPEQQNLPVGSLLLAAIQKGQGAKAVLWAVSLSLVVSWILLRVQKVFKHKEMIDHSYRGMAHLMPVVLIMLLSFAIGSSCKELGTGTYVSGLVGSFLPAFLVAPLLFLSAAFMSFTTGTSWGTFAILIPVGLPLASAMGLPEPMLLAAVLGGGVFGDHCSPISDTTLISSLASGCDHLEHVRTQIPYALVAAGATTVLYLLLGLFV